MIEALINVVLDFYDVNKPFEKLNGGYQNDLYTCFYHNEQVVLRLVKSNLRTEEEVLCELEFIEALSKEGLNVSTPILSKNFNVLETITIGDEKYYMTLFTYAKGKKLTYPEYLGNECIYYQLGKLTAKLHKVSERFLPKLGKRSNYLDNVYLKQFKSVIPKEKVKMHHAFDQVMHELKHKAINHKHYGLIHGDINVGNFHVDNNVITLFDFDECQYSFYSEDIAIQLFYKIYVYGDSSLEERYEAARLFLKHFLKGYLEIRSLEESVLKDLPLFLKVRELILYVGIHKKWDFNKLNQWQKDYYQDSTNRIEKGVSLYDEAFTYASLLNR